MSQQNIDFGTFPDDPSADAIRTAFQKVQNNFDQLFSNTIIVGVVTSINKTAGAGITVNQPTGEVVVSANIACLQVSTSSLKVGRATDNSQSFVTITNSSQKLNIDIDPAQVLSNYFANPSNGLANFNGTLTSNSNAQLNITSIGTLIGLNVAGNASFTGSNTYVSDIANLRIPGGSPGALIQTDGAGNLIWGGAGFLFNGDSNVVIPTANSNINLSVNGNANVLVVTDSNIVVEGDVLPATTDMYSLGNGTANWTDLHLSGNINIGSQKVTSDSTSVTFSNTVFANNLSVTANSNVGNLESYGIISALGNITGGNIITGGTLSVTGNANVGNLGFGSGLITGTGNITTGNLSVTNLLSISNVAITSYVNSNLIPYTNASNTLGNTTNKWKELWLSDKLYFDADSTISSGKLANGNSNISIATANGDISISSAGNVGVVIVSGAGANITGRANVTGNLSSGNANLGNLAIANYVNVTANLTSGNANLGNLTISNHVNVTANLTSGNANLGNLATANYVNVTANITSGNANLGYLAVANYVNVSITLTTGTANVLGNVNANNIAVTSSGNITGANVIVANTFQGSLVNGSLSNGNSNINIPLANGNVNISAVGNANILVITGTGANITGTANITGNANVGNLGAVGLITAAGNVSAGNFTTTGAANILGNANVGNLGFGTGQITGTGNITGGNLLGTHANGTSNVNIPTLNGNVTVSVASNANVIVVTGTGMNVAGTANVSGNANVGNLGAAQILATSNVTAPQLISNVATGTSPLAVTSTTRVSNLNVSYSNVSDYAAVTLINTGTYYPAFISGSSAGNYALSANAGILANIANGGLTATMFVGRLTGNVTGAIVNGTSNINIPSLNGNINLGVSGNANVLVVTGSGANIIGTANVSGNLSAGNLSVIANANIGNIGTNGQIISSIVTGTAPLTVSSTTRVANLNVEYANVSDYGTVSTQSTGTFYPVFVNSSSTGNYTHSSNANLSFNAATGNLSTTLLNVTSNANVGNLGATRIFATGNVTTLQLISNIATGTAPLIVTSTTRVSNLNVSYANVSDFNVVTTQITGTFYPAFINGTTTGNYALAANSGISYNVSNGGLTATTFVGNLIGNSSGAFANGNSNINIPIVNSSITMSVAGNANVIVVSGTGANLTGTINILPKVTPTVVTSPQFTIGESTSNANYQMRLAYINDPSAGYISAIQSVAVTAVPSTLALNPSGGNVVIGNTVSNAKFDVYGSGRFVAAASGSRGAIILRQNATDSSGSYIQWTDFIGTTQTGFMVVDPVGVMSIGTLTSARITILNNGYVGVGNANPLNTFSVNGNTYLGGNLTTTGYTMRSVVTGIVAAGSSQGAATPLTKEINIVSTVAPGANGVILPTAVAGMTLFITNTSATDDVSVYPATGAAINTLGSNNPFTLLASTTKQFIAPTTTQWYSVG